MCTSGCVRGPAAPSPIADPRAPSRIEQGIARLTGDSALKLASAFGMDLDEFLSEVAEAAADSRVVRAEAAY